MSAGAIRTPAVAAAAPRAKRRRENEGMSVSEVLRVEAGEYPKRPQGVKHGRNAVHPSHWICLCTSPRGCLPGVCLMTRWITFDQTTAYGLRARVPAESVFEFPGRSLME